MLNVEERRSNQIRRHDECIFSKIQSSSVSGYDVVMCVRHTRDMIHSYEWQFTRTSDMTHSKVWDWTLVHIMRVVWCLSHSLTWVMVQPIPLGVTFSNAVSKLKAQSSKISFHWNVAKETFELWALCFRKCHPKWDWLYSQRTWDISVYYVMHVCGAWDISVYYLMHVCHECLTWVMVLTRDMRH